MVEDTAILNNFSGKELAVTTGLGFRTEKELINLAKGLVNRNASGLIINTGEYIHEIPQELILIGHVFQNQESTTTKD